MSLSFIFAAREMRSGIKGFRIFLACLALGVAALAAAGSTAEAFRQGLAAQSRDILGGDIAVTVEGRRFTEAEQAAFRRLGRVSDGLHVRAMAATDTNGDVRRLVEVSGVDNAYPLAGTIELQGASDLQTALSPAGGIPGAAVAPELLLRLHLRPGDRLRIGEATFRIRVIVRKEPDALSRGFQLGPGVLVARDALLASGILQADALYGEAVTVALPGLSSPDAAIAALKRDFPNAGFSVKGRGDAVSGLRRLVDQLGFFLSFIGLASLLTGRARFPPISASAGPPSPY
jgi:putative ABC transport system permease protein